MNSAGVKLLAAILGFWVFMRTVNKGANHRSLVDVLLGQSGSADAPLPAPSVALASNVTPGAVTPTSPGATTSSIAQLVPTMNQIARKYGWNTAQVSSWQQVIGRESGGNSTILGSPTILGNNTPGISRAFGIGQFLGSTFTHYLGPYGGTRATPTQQLEAMATYIKDRYGTPAAAQQHEVVAGWY